MQINVQEIAPSATAKLAVTSTQTKQKRFGLASFHVE